MKSERKPGGKPPFIRKEEALNRLFSAWQPRRSTETIPLTEGRGRVLAEDLYAKYNIPVVRASAMDGVAIRYESVKDGIPDTTKWTMGREFVRADTGDDFPDGYDTVIMIEQCTVLPEGGLRFAGGLEIRPGMNVRPCGSTLSKGTLVGKAGTKLTPSDLAAIGMGGYAEIPVVKKPVVAFVPTGSELVPIGSDLQRGQNFDTNSLMVAELLKELGARPLLCPIHRDDPVQLKNTLDDLLEKADIILLNAGTSKGSEDYCGQLLEKNGALFHGVCAVPGRPMSMAVINGKAVVNLSGPAVAAFYSVEWAIAPMVCACLGIPAPQHQTVTATLTKPLMPPPPMSMCVKVEVTRAEDGSYLAAPLGLRGPGASDAATSLRANAMYITTPGEKPFAAGDKITVQLLRGIETI